MRIRRMTISLPDSTARRIKMAAAGGSVSAWVAAVVEDHLDEAELERLWLEFYESVGPRREDVRRADSLFKRLTGPSRRKSAA